nr:hypothetical protein [Delftia sp. RIT313]
MLDLTWNADHQLIESNTTRHGVTRATRYAYDPLGRRVSKRCLRQHPLPVGWRPHGAQPARYKTGALYLRAGERCATGHHSGSGRGTQPLLVPMRPDWRATRVDRRTRPRGLGRTTAYSWTTGRGISLWD